MARWVDLDNPKIIKEGRDKFGNVIYGVPPDTEPADVRPVARGRWIGDGDCIICSNCKTAYTFMGSNFCPHCGADMRGGDADGNEKD